MWIYIFCVNLIILWIRCKFWNRQPISHICTFTKRRVLSSPIFNKYCDTLHVVETTPENVIEYLQEKSNGYEKKQHLMGYLKYSYITCYLPLQGCMTSRKVNFFYPLRMHAYYHDFIHADTDAIRRTLFQTHEYMRSIKTKCPISIFSTEKRIPFLVPVTRYPIQWVKTNTFKKYEIGSFVRVNSKNLYTLYELWKTPLPCQMTPDLMNIEHMIHSKILSMYYYYTTELEFVLFFKNTLSLEKNECILDWVGTISVTKKCIHKAVSTLFHSFRKTYPIVRIHQISDTPYYKSYKTTEKMYYIYNYGIERISPKECLFI
jgi:hypothetical protein